MISSNSRERATRCDFNANDVNILVFEPCVLSPRCSLGGIDDTVPEKIAKKLSQLKIFVFVAVSNKFGLKIFNFRSCDVLEHYCSEILYI